MKEIPQTRKSLLLELGKQSDDAWTEFLLVYEDALYRFCRARGLQDADAKDVLQNVLEAVLKRVPTWDHDASGSFRGWLFRVARNISVDAIDHRAKKATGTGDSQIARLLSEVPNPQTAETTFEFEYQSSLFDWASKRVKSEVREVTWLSFCLTAIDGQKAEHVAEKLGVSVGSVYTAKCRVVARIRAMIATLDDGFNPELK
ncbi:MAG: RNA polymerase sigma factor [Mariniblastus sp.]